jgi:hypothetical protein
MWQYCTLAIVKANRYVAIQDSRVGPGLHPSADF